MKVTAARVCADVRILLNRDERYRGLLDIKDTETLTLDRRITAMMPRAVAETELEAPPHLLDGGYDFADGDDIAVERCPDPKLLKVTARLPPDFMRLVSLRFTGSDTALHQTLPADDTTVTLMRLPGASALIAGHGPVASVERRNDCLHLTVWCERTANEEPEIAEAVYRPIPEWDRDGALEISRRLYDTAVLRCAEMIK